MKKFLKIGAAALMIALLLDFTGCQLAQPEKVGPETDAFIGFHIVPIQGKQQEHDHDDDHIGRQIGIDIGNGLFVHGLAVIADDHNLPGAEDLADISAQALEDQKHSCHLNAAAGRATG